MFASVGGLALLAEHLPLLFPEISRQITLADSSSETTVGMADTSQDWVTVDSYPEDFYDVRSILFLQNIVQPVWLYYTCIGMLI